MGYYHNQNKTLLTIKMFNSEGYNYNEIIFKLDKLSKNHRNSFVEKVVSSVDIGGFFTYIIFQQDFSSIYESSVMEFEMTDQHVPLVEQVLNSDRKNLRYFYLFYAIFNDIISDSYHLQIILDTQFSDDFTKDAQRFSLENFINKNYVLIYKIEANNDNKSHKIFYLTNNNSSTYRNYSAYMLALFNYDENKLTLDEFLKSPNSSTDVPVNTIDTVLSVSGWFPEGHPIRSLEWFSHLKYNSVSTLARIVNLNVLTIIYVLSADIRENINLNMHKDSLKEEDLFLMYLSRSSDLPKLIQSIYEPLQDSKSHDECELMRYYAYRVLMNYSVEDFEEFVRTFHNLDFDNKAMFKDNSKLPKMMEYFDAEEKTMSFEMWLNLSDILDK